MHELLLFGIVPESHHHHILSVLAGVTAMHPLPLLEHHLIFKPTRKPSTTPQASSNKVNQGSRPSGSGPTGLPSHATSELFYLQVVGDLTSSTPGSALLTESAGTAPASRPAATIPVDVPPHAPAPNGTSAADPGAGVDPSRAASWTLEFRDLPDVQGKRPATSRLMGSIPVTAGDPRLFVEALGYV